MQAYGKTCCFTGYRPYTHEFQPNSEAMFQIKQAIGREIDKAVRDGYTHFICGNALGVDTWAALLVLERKKLLDSITLEIAIPYDGHNSELSQADMCVQRKIHKAADYVHVVSDENHINAYEERDKYMVDSCSLVIAVFDEKAEGTSGTKRTVDYAIQTGKPLVLIPWMDICKKALKKKKTKQHRGIYVYEEHEGFQYRYIEAIDDAGHKFSFKFTHTDHEGYIKELKDLWERFEEYGVKTCGFKKSLYDDVWFLNSQSALTEDFYYDTLFPSNEEISKEQYDRNWEIYEEYRDWDINTKLGMVDWCCQYSVEFYYGIETTHIKKPLSYRKFVEKYSAGRKGAEAVKAVVDAFKRLIHKKIFTEKDIENMRNYVLENYSKFFDDSVSGARHRKSKIKQKTAFK